MRTRIAASAFFIWLCSDFDHAADVAVVLFCACCSPMRGWLRNASSQSDGGSPRQHPSAAANSFCSLAKGRIAVNFRAQAGEPQQERTSATASPGGSVCHRARIEFMRTGPQEIPAADCPQRAAGKEQWSEYHQWEQLLLPELAALRRSI